MARPRHLPSQTIVIKLGVYLANPLRTCHLTSQYYEGTSSIVHETTHQPLLSTLSAIVETVVHLRAQGHKVVLVSSGAIGVGLKRMEVATRPKALSKKQVRTGFNRLWWIPVLSVCAVKALAAIGQGRLIALWDNLFGQLGQPIAQILLTRGDISDVRAFLKLFVRRTSIYR